MTEALRKMQEEGSHTEESGEEEGSGSESDLLISLPSP
jgi:hypothetical protein